MAQLIRPADDASTLLQKFRQHGRHHAPFANTTTDGLNHIRKRWALFCSKTDLGEPMDALRKAHAPEYKSFFQWIILNPERGPQQALTLMQYFRLLKMLYHGQTGFRVDEEEVKDVNTFIKHHAIGKKESSPRPKPVLSGDDVVRILHYLYKSDRAVYPDERHRVQQGFLILIHAFSGVRPSSTTRTRTMRPGKKSRVDEEPMYENEELVKLRYSDLEIFVTTDEHGHTRFAMCITFNYFKGNLRRRQQKTFTWCDQADVLTCPVAHLVALALFDKAFHLPSLRDARSVFSLTAPKGKRLPLRWRHDILGTPIIRESSDVTSCLELSASVSRLVLNAVDGAGSEEVRNQVAGHLEGRTYRNSYQNQRIELDIPSLVLGQAAEDTFLIKQLSLVSADMDPAANISLPLGAHDQIATLPDVEALNLEYRLAADLVRRAFGSLKEAPESDPRVRDCNQKMQKLRAKKEFYRTQMKSRLREEYFEWKNDMLVDAQLSSTNINLPTAEAPVPLIPSMPERAELISLDAAADMRSSDMLDVRIAAVQAMTDLCGRVETPHRSIAKQDRPAAKAAVDHEGICEAGVLPMQCHNLQCLFCISDERLIWSHRTKTFSRLQKLWDHAEKHLEKLPGSEVHCPHPQCKTQTVILKSIEHFLSHVQIEHNIRLRCR